MTQATRFPGPPFYHTATQCKGLERALVGLVMAYQEVGDHEKAAEYLRHALWFRREAALISDYYLREYGL